MTERLCLTVAKVALAALLANIASISWAAAPGESKSVAKDRAATANAKRLPITVSGRAIDPDGQPIEGATIFLVATNGAPAKQVAQTKTDKEGRYAFPDFQLPLRVPRIRDPNLPPEGYEEGTFQVFGKAPGHGFAWHGMKTLFADPRFIGPDGKPTVMRPELGYFPGDKIAIELKFLERKPITGRVVDDRGKPITGMKLSIGSCDYTDLVGKQRDESFRNFNAIGQAVSLMPDQLTATTDADGRFSFDSLPPDVMCHVSTKHTDFAALSFNTTTAEPPLVEHKGEPVLPPPVNLSMAKARAISAVVRFADNKKPAPDALLTAYKQLGNGTRSWGYADKEGKVTLKLPPGEYTLSAIPPKETDYVATKTNLVVSADEKQTVDVALELGGVLVLEAIDLATGKPIGNVDFWFKDDKYPWDEPGKREPGKRWHVQSNTVTNDFPKSDGDGKVRAVIYPGSRLYGIGVNPLPDGYKAAPEDHEKGRMIDVPAGTTVSYVFFLKK